MPHLSPLTSHFSPPPAAWLHNPALSLWLSVDPLADKYPGVSPYAYCANNPVRLVDKDGREIVDRDGNVCYTQKDGWLPNAPEDTKRIGDAMMETEVGREQFNNLVNSKTKVALKIGSTTDQDKYGTIKMSNAKFDSYGDIIVENATITIFENVISDYLNERIPGNISEDKTAMGRIAYAAKPTLDQYIGAVACHETEHLSPDNLKINNLYLNNPTDELQRKLELEPERKKAQYFLQLRNHKSSGRP